MALGVAFVLASTPASGWARNPNSVNYYLTTPEQFKGGIIVLDIVAVQPVNWKSPIPEITFFRAMSWDSIERAPGGDILVAVPAGEATRFVKKYGTTPRGNDPDKLKGVLLTPPGGPRPDMKERPAGLAKGEGDRPKHPQHRPGGPGGPQMWMVDYEGMCKGIIAEHQEEMKKLHNEDGPGPGSEER
jgi:hypothetical protein